MTWQTSLTGVAEDMSGRTLGGGTTVVAVGIGGRPLSPGSTGVTGGIGSTVVTGGIVGATIGCGSIAGSPDNTVRGGLTVDTGGVSGSSVTVGRSRSSSGSKCDNASVSLKLTKHHQHLLGGHNRVRMKIGL